MNCVCLVEEPRQDLNLCQLRDYVYVETEAKSNSDCVYALNDVKTGDCLYAENDSIRDCVYADQTQEISDLAKKEDHQQAHPFNLQPP